MSNIKQNIKVNLNAKHDAFTYQAEAFEAIKDMKYSAIFHEQGLGKTKIAIDLALYWLNKKDIDTVLIVTKKQLVKNWVDEIHEHSYIKPKILDSNKGRNFSVLNSAAKVIITNFEMISSELERIKLFLKARSVAMIIDESTKLKNPEAKITKNFISISNLLRIKTIMTGTPVANRPYDIWSQIYFLDEGQSLGDNFEEFKRNTDLSNKLIDSEEARESFENTVGDIFNKINGFTVRETKKSSGIQLPEKIYESVYAEFEVNQREMYYKIVKDLSLEITKNNNTFIDDESESLKRLLRLNQVASNPRLVDEGYKYKSGKEVVLDKLLHNIIEKNEKCIVWTGFVNNIEEFYKKYKLYNPTKVHGGMGIDDRNNSIKKFKEDNDCKVLFATPQAAKEGLTLTIANNAIFYDRTFNLDDYLQAQDRIHRISQTKTCNIFNVIIEESIDKWIDILLNAKQYAAFLAQGDIDKTQYRKMADYSYGEIIKEILAEEQNHGRND